MVGVKAGYLVVVKVVSMGVNKVVRKVENSVFETDSKLADCLVVSMVALMAWKRVVEKVDY